MTIAFEMGTTMAITVQDSSFTNCKTEGPGGAIRFDQFNGRSNINIIVSVELRSY